MGIFKQVRSLYSQRFDDLKQEARDKGELFKDASFPASNESISYSGKELPGSVVWKRPPELCDDPHLIVDGMSALDMTQGSVGNCWFIAASSCLAKEPELWKRVIPDVEDQDWNAENPEKYAGIFHFRFWQFGEWVDVVIDDLLPTINGELVYAHSKTKNEFWCALLEKAYAKLFGSYEALDGGNLIDALVDFTSGFGETFSFEEDGFREKEEKRMELFRSIRAHMDKRSLVCSAIAACNQDEMEARMDVGLVKGHAYGVTGVQKVYTSESDGLLSMFANKEKIYLVRLKNPWGEKEWNGPFSDGSEEWNNIPQSEKEKLGLTFENDGEFWMLFDDFCKYFTDMSVCQLVNTSWFTLTKTWKESLIISKWTRGEKGTPEDKSGGCANNKESYLRNPQFRFNVDNDTESVLLMLQQKDRRDQRCEGKQNLVIGFQVLKVEANRRYRLRRKPETVVTSEYVRTRNIFLRHEFSRGRYYLIPTTFDAGEEGDFIVRVFSGSLDCELREVVKEVPSQSSFPCIGYPTIVTKVTVISATGLSDGTEDTCDPYVVIKCEKDTVKSAAVPNNPNPTFNFTALFYRRDPSSPIKIQIYNKNRLTDTFMGKVLLDASQCDAEKVVVESDLSHKGNKSDLPPPPGKMVIEYQTVDDLMAF